MFQNAGKSKIAKTAVQLVCNVAWASSLGGLALLAEERRRRVAFAQKIIENGKKLQAHKSYNTAAALTIFDLGEEWNTDLPNHAPKGENRMPPGKVLTNNEWRSRGRLHRPTPTKKESAPSRDSTPSSWTAEWRPLLRTVPSSTLETLAPIHYTFNPSEAARDSVREYAPQAVQISNVRGLSASVTAERPMHDSLPRPDPQPIHKRRYVAHLQSIVARRITECFTSDDTTLRRSGFRELSVFFEQPRPNLGHEMLEAVTLVWNSPRAELQMNLNAQARKLIQASLNSSRNASSAATPAAPNDIFPRPLTTPMAVDEEGFVAQVRTCIRNGQLDGAFYEFLALCERATAPVGGLQRSMTTGGRRAIRDLIIAYRDNGLFSVVYELQEKTLHLLKTWQLVYADSEWLMDQRSAQNNADFCWEATQVFKNLERMKKDSMLRTCVNFVQWFVARNHPKQGVYLFNRIFQSDCLDSDDQAVICLANDLYRQNIESNLFEEAQTVLSWLTGHGLQPSGDPTWASDSLNRLIRAGKLDESVDFYLATLGFGDSPGKARERFTTAVALEPDFEKAVYALFRDVITELYCRRNFGLILKISASFGADSRLPHQTSAILYSAFAKAGPLSMAKEKIQHLAASGVLLQHNIVYESHAELLHRCWTTTRNFEMTHEIFRQIRGLGCHQQRFIRTMNSMLLACVQSGNRQLMHKYINEITDNDRLEPDLTTWSYILLAKGIEGDWDPVLAVLEDTKPTGIRPLIKDGDGQFFDKVFAAFCRQYTADKVVDFAIRVTGSGGLSITNVTSKMVIDAVTKAESMELLVRWIEHVKDRGFEALITQESVGLLLHRSMQSEKLKYNTKLSVGECLEVASNANTTSELLDSINAINTQQGSQEVTGCRSPLSGAVRMKDAGNQHRRKTERAMLNALSNKDPEEAVRLYNESLKNGLPLQQVDLELAIHAVLTKTPGSTKEAQRLAAEAKAAGLNTDRVATTLLIHDIRGRPISEQEAYDLVFGFYATVDEPRVRLHHHVTIAAARQLLSARKADAALRLIKSVHDSEWGRRKPFDIAAMTLTLRLLIELGHTDGTQWVMDHVLRNTLRIDQKFIDMLLSRRQAFGQRRAREFSTRGGHVSRLEKMVDEYIVTCRARREEQRMKSLQFAKDMVNVFKGAQQIPGIKRLERESE